MAGDDNAAGKSKVAAITVTARQGSLGWRFGRRWGGRDGKGSAFGEAARTGSLGALWGPASALVLLINGKITTRPNVILRLILQVMLLHCTH